MPKDFGSKLGLCLGTLSILMMQDRLGCFGIGRNWERDRKKENEFLLFKKINDVHITAKMRDVIIIP